jgi:hypothetical protein
MEMSDQQIVVTPTCEWCHEELDKEEAESQRINEDGGADE